MFKFHRNPASGICVILLTRKCLMDDLFDLFDVKNDGQRFSRHPAYRDWKIPFKKKANSVLFFGTFSVIRFNMANSVNSALKGRIPQIPHFAAFLSVDFIAFLGQICSFLFFFSDKNWNSAFSAFFQFLGILFYLH